MIHHGDALDVLHTLGAGSVDAIITDPPYCSGGFTETQRRGAKGQGLRSETLRRDGWFRADNMGTAGLACLLRCVGVEACRVVKPSGSLLVFMDWRMLATLVPAIESSGLRYQNLVVWDKGSIALGHGFRPQHELIAHFTNGTPEFHDKSTGNVLRCGRVSSTTREHPTAKPVELMRQLIRVAAPLGGTVCDPFAGSGSTGVAAKLESRQFIGVERDAAYCEIARRRISEAT